MKTSRVGMNWSETGRNSDLEDLTSGEIPSIAYDRSEPLDVTLRQQLERAFGSDFSGVMIHTGAVADEMTRRAGAQALALGEDVYFAGGQYNPQSTEGIKLLVHEMQHILQYRRGDRMQFLEDIEELEAQADRMEALIEDHALHNLSQPLMEQDGPLLNPGDQGRSLGGAALAKSGGGSGGNLEDFQARSGELQYRVRFVSSGTTIVVNAEERKRILEAAKQKVETYLEDASEILDTQGREDFLTHYLAVVGRS